MAGVGVRTVTKSPGARHVVAPTEIPRRCILAGSREGDLVLDPFAGAGTTLMVALRLGRRALGIELKPEYVTLARARIEGDAPLWNTLTRAAGGEAT